jgi:universal stress protein A
MKMDTILVPTDFSEDAKRALEMATGLAQTFGSRIVLLHTYHINLPLSPPGFVAPVILPEGFYVECRNQATFEVERLAKEAAAQGLEVTGVAVEGAPWTAVMDQVKALPADLIVMGTRGLTGIKHVALGSTAERVVRMATCPVLTVKAD